MTSCFSYFVILLSVLSPVITQSESVFRVLTEEELNNLDFSHGPHLLEVAARTGENVTVPISSVSQGAVVQDNVRISLNCTPWLMKYPGGTITWYKTPFRSRHHELLSIRYIIPRGNTYPYYYISGENSEIYHITWPYYTFYRHSFEPNSGIYECQVCTNSSESQKSKVCHSANTTVLNVGRPPIIDQSKGYDPVTKDRYRETYKVGSDIVIHLDPEDPTRNVPMHFFELQCGDVGDIQDENIPYVFPTPNISWHHTGLDGNTAYYVNNLHPNVYLSNEFMLPLEFEEEFPDLATSDVLSGTDYPPGIEFSIWNVTKNLSQPEYIALKQAYGLWTCTYKNSFGQVSASTFISDTYHCPNLTDPDHGSVQLSGRSIIDTANYSCDIGYTLIGVSSVTCERSGSWSHPPPICVPAFPELPALTIEYESLIDRVEARFSCTAGYGLVGYPVLTYHQSSWNKEPPECKLICDELPTPIQSTVPGRVKNVRSPECGRLEWDAQEGVTYKLRFYTSTSYFTTPTGMRKIISSSINTLTFTEKDVPTGRPLYVIVKARNSNGVHSNDWSTPITAAGSGCLES